MELDTFQETAILRINGDKLQLSSLDERVIDQVVDCIKTKDNHLVIYPNKKLFLPLVILAVLRNEASNFRYFSNPCKRTTVLVLTNRKSVVNTLQEFRLLSTGIFEICQKQHQYFMEKGIFCDISDPFFTRVYWRHHLSNYYEGQIEQEIPLHFIYPISFGYTTFQSISRGNRNMIGRKDAVQQPVFFITDNIKWLGNMECDYTFVDCSYMDKQLPPIPDGTLLFFNSPLDDRISYASSYMNSSIYYDGKTIMNIDIAEVNNKVFSMEKTDMLRTADINNLNIEYIKANFEQSLEDAYSAMIRLKKKAFNSYDLAIISNLLYTIMRMPVEGIKYDEIATDKLFLDSIRDQIKELKESDNRYEDDDFEEVIKLIEDIFNKHSLDTFCPKYDAIKDIVIEGISKNKIIGIITSNKISNFSLKEKLSFILKVDIDQLEDYGVKFFNKKHVLKGIEQVECDYLILFSALTLKDLSVFLNSKYQRIFLYLYRLELNEIRRRLQLTISLFPGLKEENSIYKYFLNRIPKSSINTMLNEELNFAQLINHDLNISLLRQTREYKGTNSVDAYLIKFKEVGSFFIKKNSKVRCIDKKSKKLIYKKFSELKIGDEILFIENDLRQDIFKVFIEAIEGEDEMSKNFSLIEKWRVIYEDKFLASNICDDKLFNKMQMLGWDKVTKVILKNWRSGFSYGPRDIGDIEVLGRALNIDEFIQNTEAYFRAMTKVRVERRTAARILNKVIYYSNKKLIEDEVNLLEKYNLTVDLLRSAVKIRKIQSISERTYRVKPSEINILFDEC